MKLKVAMAPNTLPPNSEPNKERYIEKLPPEINPPVRQGTITRDFDFANIPKRENLNSYFDTIDYDSLDSKQIIDEIYKAMDYMEEKYGWDVINNATLNPGFCQLKQIDEYGTEEIVFESEGDTPMLDYLKFLHNQLDNMMTPLESYNYSGNNISNNVDSYSLPPKDLIDLVSGMPKPTYPHLGVVNIGSPHPVNPDDLTPQNDYSSDSRNVADAIVNNTLEKIETQAIFEEITKSFHDEFADLPTNLEEDEFEMEM